MSAPAPVEGPEGEVIGYECPGCGTMKTTESKAATHCVEDDNEGESDGQHRAHSSETAFPTLLDERGYYVPTARDEIGRKRPRAPHVNGHSYPAKWSADLEEDERPETDLETARKIAQLSENELESAGWELPEGGDSTMSVGAILPADRPPEDERVALIDWDDVRDPETEEIHPVCAEFLRRYPGYADISVSGTGIHQLVLGGLGEHGGKFIAYIDDEPAFEALDTDDGKDDWPQVEIYDGGRHVHMSGNLVDGAENETYDGQEFIDELIDRFEESATAHPQGSTVTVTETKDDGSSIEREVQVEAEYTGPDPDEWDIPEDRCLEYHATVEAHYHGYSTGNFWRVTGAAAAWGNKLGKTIQEVLDDLLGAEREGVSAGYGGKTEGRVQYDWQRAETGAFEPPSRRTLAKMGILPADYATDDSSGTPVAALPLAQLDALEPEERRRAARKRGHDWPTTEDARERLFQTITEAMRGGSGSEGDDRVIDAPTSLGKSHAIATTPWDAPQYDGVTGEQPVIHLSKTTDARDEAVEKSQNAGVDHFVLLGRHDACACARGDHDPHECEDEDRQPITIDGEPVSEWMDKQCDVKGLPLSVVHTYAQQNNDQNVDLPCREDGECYSTRQWEKYREGDHRLVHATHNFAFVPGVRAYKNLVFDEEPDFEQEITTERAREAIGAYLREVDAPVTTWEQFITLSTFSGGGDAGRAKSQLKHTLDEVPRREWFIEHPDAHILAPGLAKAIFYADERKNERRFGDASYEPPRLDAEVSEDDGWNRERVKVTLNAENDIETVRVTPDLNSARSVIGMDAHPAMPVWQANTLAHIERRKVLEPEERRLWRRYERGLRVVQVGEATRPLASDYAAERYVTETALTALMEQLRESYEDGFRTAITTNAVEESLREMMADVGINAPETMHYGEEKSRNDFADEDVGLVNGCIDPGDDHIINLIAELDLDAEPERGEEDCEDCAGSGCNQCHGTGKKRAHGRGFVGEDAETAAEILASVRENHTAQSAGRYARNPDNPQDSATVFVRTDAMPPGFADVQVPGVVWAFGDKQQQLAEYLRAQPTDVTAKDAAEAVGCSKKHAHKTLQRWAENGTVQAFPKAGYQGATLYAETGLPTTGVADLGEATITPPVQGYRTYQFTTCEPTTPANADVGPTSSAASNEGDSSTLDWANAVDDRGGSDD